jgi:hypothetical protein
MSEIPARERLPSQIYAEWAKKWVALDRAARLLEENKKTVFYQYRNKQMQVTPKPSIAVAEGNVYALPEYIEYLHEMVELRFKANEAKIAMRYAELRAQEHNSEAAAARMERRMMGNNG